MTRPLRYVIADSDGVAWTDTDHLDRARKVADALQAAGHGAFDVIDAQTGLTHYTSW